MTNKSYRALHFPGVRFIMLYKAVATFDSVYEILECNHSIESY